METKQTTERETLQKWTVADEIFKHHIAMAILVIHKELPNERFNQLSNEIAHKIIKSKN